MFVLFQKNTMNLRLNAQFTMKKASVINNLCQQSKCTFELCVSHVLSSLQFSLALHFYISE